MDAVRLTTALRVSGREGRLGVVEVVDVDGEDPVIVAAAGAAVGAAVIVEVLGAEVGSATNLSSVDLRYRVIVYVLTGACPSSSPLPRLRWRYRRHESALPVLL